MKELQQSPALKNCPLAGGTALALQLGHRISVDLDFFYPYGLDMGEVKLLFENYPGAMELSTSKNILVWNINNMKVDVVNYNYPPLYPFINEDGVVLYALEDIAAMKLEAIKGRGRKRDFYDLYFLLKKFSLEQMLDFNKEKYKTSNMFLVLKSLGFFEDADSDPEIEVPHNVKRIDWEMVKKKIFNEASRIL